MLKALLLLALVGHQALAKSLAVDFAENLRQGRIVSGWEASPGQFPYQVALRALDQQWRMLACGGSVINEEWVLTAAHCTANYLSVTVLAGLVQVNSPEVVLESDVWYNHPSYDGDRPNTPQLNDIALIKLPSALSFSANLNSIKLQPSSDAEKNYAEIQLSASGFGRTWTDGPLSDSLMWVYLRGVSNDECRSLYGSYVSDATVCARFFDEVSQSICQGDTGGPLIWNNEDGEDVLIGVGSFVPSAASGGCHSGLPAGFIRAGPFHSWFSEVTGINFDETEAVTPEPESESSESSEESDESGTTANPEEESSESSESDESEENPTTQYPEAEETTEASTANPEEDQPEPEVEPPILVPEYSR